MKIWLFILNFIVLGIFLQCSEVKMPSKINAMNTETSKTIHTTPEQIKRSLMFPMKNGKNIVSGSLCCGKRSCN